MDVDVRTLPWEKAYGLLIGSVIPRPIAWVSTVGEDGVYNVAPFSFFNAFCPRPMMLGFSMMNADDRPRKDTLANVVATREFAINLANEDVLEQMDLTSRPIPASASEFEDVGLTPKASVVIRPPSVAEAPVTFECRLFEIVDFGGNPGAGSLVIGECVHLHIADDVMRDGRVDPLLLKPVARLGGGTYARPQILDYERHDRRSR